MSRTLSPPPDSTNALGAPAFITHVFCIKFHSRKWVTNSVGKRGVGGPKFRPSTIERSILRGARPCRISRWIHLFITGSLSLGSSGCTPSVTPQQELRAPRLVELGETWGDGLVSQTVLLSNASLSPVTIESFQASCRCTSINPPKVTIPPAGTAAITVSIDTHIPSNELSIELTSSVVPITTEGTPHTPLRINCRVFSPIALSTPQIDLGEFSGRAIDDDGKAFQIQLHNLCSVSRLEYNQQMFECRLESRSKSKRATLYIRPAPDLPPGEYAEPIRFVCNCNGAPDAVIRTVVASWSVTSRIQVFPRTIAMGNISRDKPHSCHLTFSSVESVNFSIQPDASLPKGVIVRKGATIDQVVVVVTPDAFSKNSFRLDVPFVATFNSSECERIIVPILYSASEP